MNITDNVLLQNITLAKTQKLQIERKGQRGVEPNIKNLSDALDEFYFLNKLKVYIAFLNYQNIANEENIPYTAEELYLAKTISELTRQVHFDNPIIQVYNSLYTLYNSIKTISLMDSKNILAALEKQLQQWKTVIPAEERLEIYSALTNFCIYRLNHGESYFRKLFFQYNNEIINIRYRELKTNELLQTSIFKNMVMVAVSLEVESSFFINLDTWGIKARNKQLNKWQWIEQFTQYYGQGYEGSDRLYYLYCKSYIAFKQNNIEEAFNTFGYDVPNSRNTFLNFDSRMLYCMIIYELQEIKGLYWERKNINMANFLAAYRRLLDYERTTRKQISTYHLSIYLQFLNCYKQLVRLRKRIDLHEISKSRIPITKNKLTQEVEQLKMPFSQWIVDKVKELA